MITVEDGPAFCEKRWKQAATCDPDSVRGSYEQRKENQSRKQYSLRSKVKEQKEVSYIGNSAISSMSSRKPTSTVEANEISVCAKPVSLDMKTPNEKTSNSHGDQSVNNYMIVLLVNQLITT